MLRTVMFFQPILWILKCFTQSAQKDEYSINCNDLPVFAPVGDLSSPLILIT